MSGGSFLYPNVTSLPGQTGVGQPDRASKQDAPAKGEFDQVFDHAVGGSSAASAAAGADPLSQVRNPLKFSAHAAQRMQERKIAIDPATMTRVNDAIDKAAAKGVEDTLVLT